MQGMSNMTPSKQEFTEKLLRLTKDRAKEKRRIDADNKGFLKERNQQRRMMRERRP